MGVCNCSMFCSTLLYVHSSIAIILMGKRELVALLNLSSWCLVMVEQLFLAVPGGCLQFVIVVFPDHTHYYLCDLQRSKLISNCRSAVEWGYPYSKFSFGDVNRPIYVRKRITDHVLQICLRVTVKLNFRLFIRRYTLPPPPPP